MSTTPDADDLRLRISSLGSAPARHDLPDRVAHARLRLESVSRILSDTYDIPEDARLRPLKRAVVEGLRPVVAPQGVYNDALADVVVTLAEVVDGLVASRREADALSASVNELVEVIDRFGIRLDSHDELRSTATSTDVDAAATDSISIDRLIARVRGLEGDLRRFFGADHLDDPHDDIEALRARIALLEARVNLSAPQTHADARPTADAAVISPEDQLYQEFEDAFRGTRAFVTEMLEGYLDDVRAVEGDGPVVDIGCGRGEWLELLSASDIEAYGLDANPAAVARCTERGLDARTDEPIAHLRSVPRGSVRAITSFHVVEHLTFDQAVQLVDAALVALAPGGLLVLETPNPTNLTVSGEFFWIDPTHLRPVHPRLLEFLLHHRGYTDIEVRWLHPRDALRLDPELLVVGSDADPEAVERSRQAVERLNSVLFGHMDYAVLAHKSDAA